MPEERKHSIWMGIGEKVISFVVGVIIASFFLGGARAKIQTLGRDMDNWKTEWKERDKHITKMDLEGSVATKNFVNQYEKEQAQQYARIKHLEEQVNHLETMNLKIDRLGNKRLGRETETGMSDILVGFFTADKQLNQIQIAGHGLLNGDTVRFTLGATGNTLPTPLVVDTWYYVVGATPDTFQVSGTSGGTAIVLTDEGTGSNEAWSPAPTENVWAYEILMSENTFTPDVTEVNWYAQRGWELMDMQQIGGGATVGRFWYLLRKQEAPSG